MTQIAKTRLGTSDQPGDICHGAFALFPAVGTVRAGSSFAAKSKTLFAVHPQLAAFRLNTSATMEFLFGVCGPAYGVRYEVDGQAQGERLQLKVHDDSMAAGFFAGCSLTFALPCKLEAWWFGWSTVFNLKPKIQIDMLNLLYELIKKLIGGKKDPKSDGETQVENNTEVEAEKPADKKKGYKVKSLSIYDFAKGSLAKDGQFSAKPSFDLPIDLVPFIPPLLPLKKALEALWGGLFVGPVVSLIIPVKVTIKDVKLDGQVYSQVKVEQGELTATAAGASAPPQAEQLGMTLSHRPGFDIGLSFGANLSVCKLFKLGGSLPRLELSKLLGIEVAAGPYDNTVENTVGKHTIAALDCRHCGPFADSPVDVVFEPPASVG